MQTVADSPSLAHGLGAMIHVNTTWKGRGMRVTVRPARGHEKCPLCAKRFIERLVCPDHPYILPAKVYIDIFCGGVRSRLVKDSDGDPLTPQKALLLKDRIETDAKSCLSNEEAARLIARRYVPRDKDKMAFSSVVKEYYAHLQTRGQGQKHITCTKSAIDKHLVPVFKDRDVADISSGAVEAWIDLAIKGGLSDYMIAKLIIYLRRVLKFATVREYINTAPVLPTWRKTEAKRHGITAEQQAEILAKIPGIHRPVLEFYAAMGWRPGEVRALKVRDLDFKTETITLSGSFDIETYKPYPKVRDKGGAEYPLEHVRHLIIAALKDRVYGPEDFVFGFKGKGGWRRYKGRYLAQIYSRAAAKAGYADVTLYEFGRHAMSYQLMLAGATPDQRAAILNNTSGTIQGHYTTINKQVRGRVLKLLKSASQEPSQTVAKAESGK